MTDYAEKQVQIVTGLVDAWGCFGGRIYPQGWTAQFRFHSWRGETGLLYKDRLSVKWNVSQEALDNFKIQIPPYHIVQAKLLFNDKNSAELIELLAYGLETDSELNQMVIELQTPISFDHERFGIFVLDRRLNWFSANTTWQGQDIRLSFEAIEDEELQLVIMVALELWNNQSQWNQRILEYAAQQLLQLKNDIWFDEDEDENPLTITKDEFMNRMRLESINISPDGNLSFWYKDGNLFAGHWIEVSGDLQTGLQDAKIQG